MKNSVLCAFSLLMTMAFTPLIALATPDTTLNRYVPTAEFDTSAVSPEIVQAIAAAFEELDSYRVPVKVSSTPAIRRIIVEETGDRLALRTFVGEYFRPWGQAYGVGSPQPAEAILTVPKGFAKQSLYTQTTQLTAFLGQEFPRKLVAEENFKQVYDEWYKRVGHRSILTAQLNNRVNANKFFKTHAIPVASISAFVEAFNDLDPSREPSGNDRHSDHQISDSYSYTMVEGEKLELKQISQHGGEIHLWSNYAPYHLMQLTIPASYRNPSEKDKAQLRAFLTSEFPKHEVPFSELRAAKKAWKNRMIAAGHLKATPTLVQRAKEAVQSAKTFVQTTAEKIHPAPIFERSVPSYDFLRYLPADRVERRGVSGRTLRLMLAAFERLEPVRPPAYGGIVSRTIRHISISEDEPAFGAVDTNIQEIPNDGMYGISSVVDMKLSIPSDINWMSDEAATSAMADFLYKTFGRKLIGRAGADQIFAEWKDRMTREGRLPQRYQPEASLAQKARIAIATPFLPNARRCEALFRTTAGN